MTNFYFIPQNIMFFTQLQSPRTIKNLQYRFRNDAIVYAFRCQVNNLVYVGSTLTPGRRFHNHLVTGKFSNPALQADITKFGVDKFTAYVFEIVVFPNGLSLDQKRQYLRDREQVHMSKFPDAQLYNAIRSSVT